MALVASTLSSAFLWLFRLRRDNRRSGERPGAEARIAREVTETLALLLIGGPKQNLEGSEDLFAESSLSFQAVFAFGCVAFCLPLVALPDHVVSAFPVRPALQVPGRCAVGAVLTAAAIVLGAPETLRLLRLRRCRSLAVSTLTAAEEAARSWQALEIQAVEAVRWVACVELAARGFGSATAVASQTSSESRHWTPAVSLIEQALIFGQPRMHCAGLRKAMHAALAALCSELRCDGCGSCQGDDVISESTLTVTANVVALADLRADLAEVRDIRAEWTLRWLTSAPVYCSRGGFGVRNWLETLNLALRSVETAVEGARCQIVKALHEELLHVAQCRGAADHESVWRSSLAFLGGELQAAVEALAHSAGVVQHLDASHDWLAKARASWEQQQRRQEEDRKKRRLSGQDDEKSRFVPAAPEEVLEGTGCSAGVLHSGVLPNEGEGDRLGDEYLECLKELRAALAERPAPPEQSRSL
eukprot:gnl/TRDRNA2_/TRDRNA2_132965_c0_seq1.p1 gnl/TRDRNA2_/TRDRNA2_132965_c0~~gnl/TRDRNA2_/TRDRNA2_132965_c0_seq1.p1  ORF type:complete len:474 (-),score=61.14 gnl/TRDRNA2_/TRDRNA2_132965_c0_seq1:58-1479(-)